VFTEDLMKKIGGYKSFVFEGYEIYVAADVSTLFTEWIHHLKNSKWLGQIPKNLNVVLTGDGGIL
jgi:hypothetical protein